MTTAADSREVFRSPQKAASRDSRTPPDSARRGAVRKLMSHEIRRREGLQIGLTRFIIKS